MSGSESVGLGLQKPLAKSSGPPLTILVISPPAFRLQPKPAAPAISFTLSGKSLLRNYLITK